MKNVIFFIVVQILIFSNYVMKAQWVQTNGPGWGFIDHIVANGDFIITSTFDNLIFISTNKGESWNGITNSMPTISSFAFIGTNIFAGTSGGVYFTSNNGNNWSPVNSGLTSNNVHSLAVNEQYIFAGTYGGGVFYSTNNGAYWEQINNGLTRNNITSISVNGADIFAGTDSGGVFHSTNNGSYWVQENNGLLNLTIKSIAVNGYNIFAATESGVYVSTDNGAHWLITNLPGNGFFCLATSGTDIFAANNIHPDLGDVYRSTNSGTDWVRVMGKGAVRALASSGTNIYASVYDQQDFAFAQGIFLSTDAGTTWTQIGLPTSSVYSFGIIGDNILAGTFFGGVFLSTNSNGTNMTQGALETITINSIVISGVNIYAGTSGPGGKPGGVLLSTDSGTTWSEINGDLPISISVFTLTLSENKIYAGCGGIHAGIYLSTNNGTNWTNIYDGQGNNYVYAITISGGNILAGTDDGLILSTNDGTNWTLIESGIPKAIVHALTIWGTNIYAGTNNGIYISNDSGLNWTQLKNGLPAIVSVYTFKINGNNLYAGTSDGIYTSTNSGSDWTHLGMDNMAVLSLAINDTYLIAGTYGAGLWYRPLSDFGLPVELTTFSASMGNNNIKLEWNTATELNNKGFDVERSSNKSGWEKLGFVKGNGNSTARISYTYVDKTVNTSGKYYYRLKQIDNDGSYKYSKIVDVDFGVPTEFALNQNYPNPFNPSTKISYRLKYKGFVNLKVYGIRGELVKVLVNESKDAGYYEAEFDGSGLASGVYLYRLEVIGDGNKLVYSDIKKTVLLK